MQWNITKQNLPFLIAKLEALDFSKKWKVVLTENKEVRTNEQNDRLWAMYKAIGDYIGYTQDEIHKMMKYKFLRTERIINDESYEVLKSTTKLTVEEMTQYQENIEIWAATELGFSWK
jgi:hypothetical protein